MELLIIIVLVILLMGGVPAVGMHWGYMPGGIVGLVLIVILILVVMRRF